ncbi:testis-expressed protein 36-like isoform X2 [Mercenaria mercenaria]|uniref:testis-expressed protein 36-like isoform X2 n=1 Tax=Mercenaria mercenaria TaxID=6596 RepID=UPI00234F9403|nr:testis-expressed protein 36-like isoform X2 [Mercenaria mercenaria]
MARGRRHVPPATEVGIWFQHRGAHSASSLQRQDATSTGSMLSGPFRSSSAQYPMPPPPNFQTKSDRNYRLSNRFSEHDNRNAFQNHGVYFGDGQNTRHLGRNLIDPHLRLHSTDKDYLKHLGREVTNYDYHSTYNKSYLGRDIEEPPRYRRFSKSLPPAEQGTVPLSTTTTAWLPTASPQHKTDTQVLAVSQEPFLKHNPWKYSYNPKRNVYPPYERRSEPVIDNMFNRYGAAFNSSSNFNSSGFSGLSALETTGCS